MDSHLVGSQAPEKGALIAIRNPLGGNGEARPVHVIVPGVASWPLPPTIEILAHTRGEEPKPLLDLRVLFCRSYAAVTHLQIGKRSSAQQPILHVDAIVLRHLVIPCVSLGSRSEKRIDTRCRRAASLAQPRIGGQPRLLAKMRRSCRILFELSQLLFIDDGVFLVGGIPLEVQRSAECRWRRTFVRRIRGNNLCRIPGRAQTLAGSGNSE